MAQHIQTDICVIGAGSGGLSVAAGAVQMGARVVLIEKGDMGGDCLNTGCVPSKSLIAAGAAAQTFRASAAFGIAATEPEIDFAGVNRHVKSVIAAIAPMDSEERFTGLGVQVIRAAARFVGPREVEAGKIRVSAKWIVVATGSRAGVPPIPGLDEVPFLTNETIFDLTSCPDHLLIVGGGPIGMEMAQAHRRLGARVTVLERDRIMPKDDPELVDVVRRRVMAEGVSLVEGAEIVRVEQGDAGPVVVLETETGQERVQGSHLLVAAGRQANTETLELEAGRVSYDRRGITVDRRLRSVSNRRVFAVGDVAGQFQFTHIAGYHAGIVIRNILFRLPAKTDDDAVPWVTYTAPELAHVGLSESAARKRYGKVRTLTWSLEENDRARAERETEGLVKIVTGPGGRVVGAGIVAPHAGELIQPLVLAVSQKIKVGALASMIAPYPTLGEAIKRAAGSYYTDTLFSDRTRRIVRFLMKFA